MIFLIYCSRFLHNGTYFLLRMGCMLLCMCFWEWLCAKLFVSTEDVLLGDALVWGRAFNYLFGHTLIHAASGCFRSSGHFAWWCLCTARHRLAWCCSLFVEHRQREHKKKESTNKEGTSSLAICLSKPALHVLLASLFVLRCIFMMALMRFSGYSCMMLLIYYSGVSS